MKNQDRDALVKFLTCHDDFCDDIMSPRSAPALSPEFGDEIQATTKQLFNARKIDELMKLLDLHIGKLKAACKESCGEDTTLNHPKKVPEGIIKQWREYRRSLAAFLFRHIFTALALRFGIEPEDVSRNCQMMETYPGIFDASKIQDALDTLKWHLRQGDNNPFRPEATVDLAALIRRCSKGRVRTLLEAFHRSEIHTQTDVKKLDLKQSLSSLHHQVEKWDDRHLSADVIPFIEKIQALPKK